MRGVRVFSELARDALRPSMSFHTRPSAIISTGPVVKRLLFAVALLAMHSLARERAVVIYPREHALFRPLFHTSHQRDLVRSLRATFDVDVHEQIATADDLFAIDVRGASLLVISGHGNPFAMSLDGRDTRTLDAAQRDRLAAFFSALSPDATIVLQSCDTGRGFAWLVKEAAGPTRHVIAAKGTIPRDGLQIGLAPLEVRITCRDEGREWDCTVRL